MAWTSPLTAVDGVPFTAAQFNASVRDNLNETSVAKTTVAGSYTVGSAANAIVERILAGASNNTTDTTTSTSYTANLDATSGPVQAATTGTKALIWLSVSVANTNVNALSAMSYAISGATTTAESDNFAIRHTSSTANAVLAGSHLSLPALTAGSNTFTSMYKTSAGTATFGARRIVVMPF